LFLLLPNSVNDTGCKFAASVVDMGGNLPPASMTPAANLPPVSTTQAKLVAKFSLVSTTQAELVAKFENLPPVSLILVANLPPVSLIPLVHVDLQISPRIFEKIQKNDPNFFFRGLGEGDSRKKPEAKNLVTLSL
jgi:hypothetical protein